ncbi:CAF17-like 4Fe-4S cluster assembly/insertion protein YgfZ [Catenuloplanes atrovinosus]|uniref:Folate-binding protein YgfZ n=1 Tax=Catenuloplanes atrovinosus TaxID=137266 RepID=A0AAE3YXW6_9ACTN|nr:folate-binding protein [Catenuloplanes atrovinosus]MDR7280428.1 folate-binding protein YgfZ [Catenuloplanes atrovinosus]
MLDVPGAIGIRELDESVPDAKGFTDVAAHYGDPAREQRLLDTEAAIVDRSHRGVLAVPGAERASWLHSLTTQHLADLRDGQGTELLVLSPHGHVEHHAGVAEIGETVWLDTEPASTGDLLTFLSKMVFLTRVEPRDATAERAVLSLAGPRAAEALARVGVTGLPAPSVQPVPGPKFPSSALEPRPTSGYAVRALPSGGFVRAGRLGYDLVVPRDGVPELVAALGVPPAGLWAYEAVRVAAGLPRAGFETDHRTLPSEVGLIEPAVHLDKGCYRGQETVARVHNLGKPPRRMVLLHLDGISSDEPPARHTPVTNETGREIGFVGTAVRHHELGTIALAVIKRNTPDDAALRVGVATAAIDPTMSL